MTPTDPRELTGIGEGYRERRDAASEAACGLLREAIASAGRGHWDVAAINARQAAGHFERAAAEHDTGVRARRAASGQQEGHSDG